MIEHIKRLEYYEINPSLSVPSGFVDDLQSHFSVKLPQDYDVFLREFPRNGGFQAWWFLLGSKYLTLCLTAFVRYLNFGATRQKMSLACILLTTIRTISELGGFGLAVQAPQRGSIWV